MKMRHAGRFARAVALAMMGSLSVAYAGPALSLSDGANTVTINEAGTITYGGTCAVPVTCSTGIISVTPAGTITWGGKIGNFTIPVVVGLTKPALGSGMDVSVQGVSTGAAGGGTLTVKWTDTDFNTGTLVGGTINAGGNLNGSTINIKGYVDGTNTPFGTGTLIGDLTFNTSPFSGTLSTAVNVPPPASATEVIAMTMGPNSTAGGDFELLLRFRPQEGPIYCRMTGGGVDTNLNWDHTLLNGQMVKNTKNVPDPIDRYTFGGQAGASTAAQPQPSGSWEHHQQTGPSGSFNFHVGNANSPKGSRMVDIRCSDPGYCRQARPAPAKQLDFDAIGTFQSVGAGSNAPKFALSKPNVIAEPKGNSDKVFTFHWVQVNVDDLGEPGRMNAGAPNSTTCPGRGFGEKSAGIFYPDPVFNPTQTVNLPFAELGECDCPDFYRITIYAGVLSTDVTFLANGEIDPNSLNKSDVIYEVYGYIDGGNLQIHPPTGSN